MHEQFDREDDVKVGTERGFGIVFAVVFAIVAGLPLIDGAEPRWWALSVAAVFLALGFFVPAALKPLNILWFRFGLLLYKIVNPVVMGLLFYLTVVPTGLLMRACGKDPLNRTFDPAAKSYWIERDPPGPAPESMEKQF